MAFKPPEPYYTSTFVSFWIQRAPGDATQGMIPCKYYRTPKSPRLSRGPHPSRTTLLFSHGNAEDIGCTDQQLARLSLGLNVDILTYDYPGYGLNQGSPTELSCNNDAMRCWEHMTTDMSINPRAIVVVGRSIGSGPAIHVMTTAQFPPVGLILVSPIMSCFGVVFPMLSEWPGDVFCNLSKIKDARCPILIMHGTSDDVVPISCGGHALWTVCKDTQQMCAYHEIIGAGHNDLLDHYHNDVISIISLFIADKTTTVN